MHVRPRSLRARFGRRGHGARRARAGPAGRATGRRRGVRRRAGALRPRRPPRARPLLAARARARARAHEGARTPRARPSGRPKGFELPSQRADAPPSPPPLRDRSRRARRGALGPARPARRQAHPARPALPRLHRRPRPRGRKATLTARPTTRSSPRIRTGSKIGSFARGHAHSCPDCRELIAARAETTDMLGTTDADRRPADPRLRPPGGLGPGPGGCRSGRSPWPRSSPRSSRRRRSQ